MVFEAILFLYVINIENYIKQSFFTSIKPIKIV